MTREFAATIFSILLAGTALAGPIERSDLPPPAQNEAPDGAELRRVIERSLHEKHEPAHGTKGAQNAAKVPAPHTVNYDEWIPSAELLLQGIPESDDLSLDALASKARRDVIARKIEQDSKIPTKFNWDRGNLRAKVGTNVTTASSPQTVVPTDLYAGSLSPSGGTGAINGRVEYDISAWQFYGGTKREVVASPDGTLGVNQNFNGGTYYNLPDTLLGGKVGTGFEVNPTGDAKTRLEYRQMFGTTEGFLAAERTVPFQHAGPDVTGVNGLKAGINRKF